MTMLGLARAEERVQGLDGLASTSVSLGTMEGRVVDLTLVDLECKSTLISSSSSLGEGEDASLGVSLGALKGA